jgi:hypothetical protein
MKKTRAQSVALLISLCVLAGCKANEASKRSASEATANGTSESELAMPKNGEAVKGSGTVEPDAVAALKKMSGFLTSLNTAQIESNGSLDVVTEDGQRIQMDGVTKYKLRKPGFVIDYASDLKKRRFFYDGKTFTEYSPSTGFYATVPAPPNNRDTLAMIYKQYGVALPLEDLFRWSDPKGARDEALKSAYQVGTATIDGVRTDHYAFREADSDWEVWIQQGDQPLPRKLVIVDKSDAARPTFVARLDWKVNPPLTDNDFTFAPDANAKRVELASYKAAGE